jgi:hypothetical protein
MGSAQRAIWVGDADGRFALVENATVTSAYETAKAGGPHAGLLRNIRATQGADQLRAGIKGYTKQIQDHEGWIADPSSRPGVSSYPAGDVARWVNQEWPADIYRLKAQRAVFEGVLKEKDDGSISGGG